MRKQYRMQKRRELARLIEALGGEIEPSFFFEN
jgi:hypothetical protein